MKRHLDHLLKDQSQANDSQIDKDIIDFPVTEPSLLNLQEQQRTHLLDDHAESDGL